MGRNTFIKDIEAINHSTVSHKRSPKQEKVLAKRLGGKVTPGSGNKEIKGDVRVKGVLRVEAKTTQHKSFSITLAMCDKIETAAMMHNELPAIIVEFINGSGKPMKELAVIPVWALEELINRR